MGYCPGRAAARLGWGRAGERTLTGKQNKNCTQSTAEFGFCHWGRRYAVQCSTFIYPYKSEAVNGTSSLFWPWTSDQQVSCATLPNLPAGCCKRCCWWWLPFLNTQGIKWVIKLCKIFSNSQCRNMLGSLPAKSCSFLLKTRFLRFYTCLFQQLGLWTGNNAGEQRWAVLYFKTPTAPLACPANWCVADFTSQQNWTDFIMATWNIRLGSEHVQKAALCGCGESF